jgi:hypothetical protein
MTAFASRNATTSASRRVMRSRRFSLVVQRARLAMRSRRVCRDMGEGQSANERSFGFVGAHSQSVRLRSRCTSTQKRDKVRRLESLSHP